MSQAMSLKISRQAAVVLSALEKKMHASASVVVEDALNYFAKKKKIGIRSSPLLECAGTISEKDAQEMLTAIKTSKKNKTKEVML